MRYRLLGRSGLRVSELALGTMTFGEAWGWGASRDESRRMFEREMTHAGVSEIPTWSTFPAETRSSSPRMTSSTGVSPSHMCSQRRST